MDVMIGLNCLVASDQKIVRDILCARKKLLLLVCGVGRCDLWWPDFLLPAMKIFEKGFIYIFSESSSIQSHLGKNSTMWVDKYICVLIICIPLVWLVLMAPSMNSMMWSESTSSLKGVVGIGYDAQVNVQLSRQ